MRGAVQEPEITLLVIEEAMDLARAREAEEQLARAPRGSRLVLDLSEVPRFDFAGVAVLLDALLKLRDYFSDIFIIGVSERIRQVFVALSAHAAEWVRVSHAGASPGLR